MSKYLTLKTVNIIFVKVLTGERQTSWLFTKRGIGLENGATVKQMQAVKGGLEPGTSGFQDLRPNPLGHAVSLKPSMFYIIFYLISAHLLFQGHPLCLPVFEETCE